MALLICPECDGDGSFTYVGGPGYYSNSYGNWLPSEREVPCETCDGFGEVEGCAVCGRQECECSDEDMEAAA